MKKIALVLALAFTVGCASHAPRFTGSDHWAETIKRSW